MYRKIGVALDDSKTAIRVFQAALKLAQMGGGNLVLIHVVNVAQLLRRGIGVGNTETLNLEAQRIGREQIAAVLRHIPLTGITVSIHIVPNHGDDVETLLLKTVKDEGCDALAMGTKGATGLRGWLIGSVAQGVLRQSPIPILLVREQNENTN